MIRNFLTRSPLWYAWHPHRLVLDLIKEVEAVIERGHNGFSYTDLKAADLYLATIIPQMLRHLDRHTFGVPEEFWDGEDTTRWHQFLLSSAEAFEDYRQMAERDSTYPAFWSLGPAVRERIEELFRHFHQLGD
jgi:hypothetical protein